MLQYTIRRILLIIPTFFLISMLIFLVLNVAPGRPGAAANDGGESQGQEQQEGYRIFKEQFNLDKPILLNTRHLTTQDDVRGWLATARNLDGQQGAAERIAAQEKLEDYGEVMVQHLLPLLDDADPRIQQAAAQTLTAAAQTRFVNDRRGDVVAARASNRLIANENQKIKGW